MSDVAASKMESSGGAGSGQRLREGGRSGRKPAARADDAMIAAFALSLGFPVYTCNPADFMGIDGLKVVSVPVPGAS